MEYHYLSRDHYSGPILDASVIPLLSLPPKKASDFNQQGPIVAAIVGLDEVLLPGSLHATPQPLLAETALLRLGALQQLLARGLLRKPKGKGPGLKRHLNDD